MNPEFRNYIIGTGISPDLVDGLSINDKITLRQLYVTETKTGNKTRVNVRIDIYLYNRHVTCIISGM